MTENNTQENTETNIYPDLDDIDNQIIRLKIKNPAITILKLADIIGMERQAISKRLHKESVQNAIKESQQTALQILLDGQVSAAKTLIELSKDGRPEDRIRASKEILKGVLSEKINIAGELSIEDKFKNLTDEQIKQRIKELESRD